MRESKDEFIQRVEGILYSYKQHLDGLTGVETIRRTTPDDRAQLKVTATFESAYMTSKSRARARLFGRLFSDDGIWVSRANEHDELVLVQRH